MYTYEGQGIGTNADKYKTSKNENKDVRNRLTNWQFAKGNAI